MGSGCVLYLDCCEDIICVSEVFKPYISISEILYVNYKAVLFIYFLNLAEYLLLLEIHSVASTNTDR